MSSPADQPDPRPTAMQMASDVDMAGKTCVITGASSGLGREAARALAGTGAHVVLAARNADALSATQSWIQSDVPDAQTSLVEVDLTSLASIRKAAAAVADIAPAIHVLMNNAGVMFTPYGLTSDGFEMQFGTNHLGHFAWTNLLQGQLEAAGESRIINLSSEGHHLSDIDLADPNWKHREYDKFSAYGATKTANVLHAVELNRRLAGAGICAYAVHPGMVATNLMRHMTREDAAAAIERSDARTLEVLTPEQGAATQVWAAVSPGLSTRDGVYLADCDVNSQVAAYAVDEARGAELWQISAALCDPTR